MLAQVSVAVHTRPVYHRGRRSTALANRTLPAVSDNAVTNRSYAVVHSAVMGVAAKSPVHADP